MPKGEKLKQKENKRNLESFYRYLNTQYRVDLQKLIGPFGRVMFGDMTDPQTWRKELDEACISETAYFSLIAWLECLLQAVVHSYDRENHDEYMNLVKIEVAAPACGSGFQGSLFPNKFLVGHAKWEKEDEDWIGAGLETLLKAWCEQYEGKFGKEAVSYVLSGLRNDLQIHFDTREFEQPKFLSDVLNKVLGRHQSPPKGKQAIEIKLYACIEELKKAFTEADDIVLSRLRLVTAEDASVLLEAWSKLLEDETIACNQRGVNSLFRLRFSVLPELSPNFKVEWRDPDTVSYLVLLENGGYNAFEFARENRIFPKEYFSGGFHDLARHPLITNSDILSLESVFVQHDFEEEWKETLIELYPKVYKKELNERKKYRAKIDKAQVKYDNVNSDAVEFDDDLVILKKSAITEKVSKNKNFQDLLLNSPPIEFNEYLLFLNYGAARVEGALFYSGLIFDDDYCKTTCPPHWVQVWRSPGRKIKVLINGLKKCA